MDPPYPCKSTRPQALAHLCMLEADSNQVRESGHITPKGTGVNWMPTPNPLRVTKGPTHSPHLIPTLVRLS